MASCLSALCHCSISASWDIDIALSISVSWKTLVAILTLLETVFQRLCFSTLCLQQGRGSTLVSLLLQNLLWRHNVKFLSRSFFNISSFFSPVSIACSRRPFHRGSHCIPMRHQSSLESSRCNVQLIRTHCTLCCFLTYAFWHTRTTMQPCWL